MSYNTELQENNAELEAILEEVEALPESALAPQVQYVIGNAVENQDSVCVVADSGASTSDDDNSAYFDAEYLLVDEDTYKLGKEAMLSLQNKHMTGNGSVAWNGWDTINQGWKDTEDATKLNGILKARYSDDPVYMSMKLPSEPDKDKNITAVLRPLIYKSADSADLDMLVNMGGIYAPVPDALPDDLVVCIGRMALYTLSNDKNAKWKLHKYYAKPEYYALYYLPWSGSNDARDTISANKIEVHDDYVRFNLTRADFSTNDAHPNSTGKLLHFWDKHSKTIEMANHKALIAFYEVWTETPEAEGLIYSTIGVDRKGSISTTVKQKVASRAINITTGKRIAICHTISDALYDELRGSPNDPRMVFEDYASVNSCEFEDDIAVIQKDLDLTSKRVDTCFETVIPLETVKVGINKNDGVWEAGYFAESGAPTDGTAGQSFRNKNYLPVEGGRTIGIYYDKSTWNNNNQGKGCYLLQYDATKTLIGARQTIGTIVGGENFTLDANTAYIKLSHNKWADLGEDISGIKIAIYYIEDAKREFVEYEADSEILYGVDGNAVVLVSPNGTKFTLSISDTGVISAKVIV